MEPKSGYAALIGRPNVGKSTLMNSLIGQKIAITSDRPQTTRDRIETVYTDERGQIIFVDTPGIHKAKNRLGEFMDQAAERAFSESDVIVWLVEPVTYIGAGEERIAELINYRNRKNRPVILVINKTDTLKDLKDIEKSIAAYEKKCRFDEIIPISAKTGRNRDMLMETLFRYLPEGPKFYDDDTVTEVPMKTIAEELIREQLLRLISDEIPHGAAVVINSFKERRRGLFDIEADIICEKDSHKGIIIGKGGSMLKKIGTQSRFEIESQLGARVNLKLFVKVRRNWRDSDTFLKSFGYVRK